MVESLKKHYEHELYKHVDDIKKAEAVGFCFLNKKDVEHFPYRNVELKDNEVKINILYAGLCHSDSMTGREKWGKVNYPIAPGHEIIGVVAELGKGCNRLKIGDKVAFGTTRYCCGKCKYCLNGKEPLCDSDDGIEKFTFGDHWGGYSTCLVQPESHYFLLKDNIKLELAAPLLCAGITVYNPIKLYCKPGFKTAVAGVGGLGHLAVKMLHKMGHEVAGITTSIKKEKDIKELGANFVIDFNDESHIAKYENYFDFIINTSPVYDGFDKLVTLTAKGGIISQVGVPDSSEKCTFKLGNIVFKEIHIIGSLVGSRSITQDMLDFCADNDVYPTCEHYSFEDFGKALDRLENGRPIFRCVVDCGTYGKKHGLHK